MSAYSSAVLALSPISYYRLNETSGTVATDRGSAANNGTYSGGFTLNQTGVVPTDATSKSVLFNGSSGGVSIPNTSLLAATATWGTIGWFNTSNATQTGMLACWNDWAIYTTNATNTGGGTYLTVNNIGHASVLTSSSTFSTGTDHMFAAIYANGLWTVMLDGVSLGTLAATSFPQGNTYLTGIAQVASVDWFAGNIGDVAFIPNITVAQVQNLYTIGTATVISGAGAAVQAAQTVSASGTVTIPAVTGTVAAVQSAQTAAGAAKETMSGTATAVQSAQTASATAKETMSGTAAAVQSAQTASAAAKETMSGAAAGVQSAQSASSTAKEAISGTAAGVQAAQTASASGTSLSPPVTGTAAAVQAAQTASASGTVGIPAVTGTGAGVQSAQSASATAKETISGTAAATQSAQTASGVAKEIISGPAAAVQAPQTAAASGTSTSIPVTGAAAAVQSAQRVTAVGHVTTTTPTEIIRLNFTIASASSIALAITTREQISTPITTHDGITLPIRE